MMRGVLHVADTSLIKQALKQAGLEIYRARGGELHLAERVRENLIMDSGVRLHTDPLRVIIVLRAQQSDFPGELPDALYARARQLAAPAKAHGYAERRAAVSEVADPGDADRNIDHWYEIEIDKAVDELEPAITELRFALALAKVAKR